MRQTRKRYNEEFKLQVIIEALRKKSTTKEVARDYNLHPDLVSRWKREFFNSIVYFELSHDKKESDLKQATAKREAKLCRKIRKLDRQLVWLKKKMAEVLPQEGRLALLDRQDSELSLPMQARLLDLDVTSLFYKPSHVKDGSYRLMKSTVFRPANLAIRQKPEKNLSIRSEHVQ